MCSAPGPAAAARPLRTPIQRTIAAPHIRASRVMAAAVGIRSGILGLGWTCCHRLRCRPGKEAQASIVSSSRGNCGLGVPSPGQIHIQHMVRCVRWATAAERLNRWLLQLPAARNHRHLAEGCEQAVHGWPVHNRACPHVLANLDLQTSSERRRAACVSAAGLNRCPSLAALAYEHPSLVAMLLAERSCLFACSVRPPWAGRRRHSGVCTLH